MQNSESTGKQLSGIHGVITETLPDAAEKLSDISEKIQELGKAATDAFSEVNSATTKAAAYFGETGEAAEETKNIVQNLYSSGIGDSMDSVANAVITVKESLQDLNSEDLTNLTQQAIALENLYGMDMNQTMQSVSTLMDQFGLSAQGAMDFIATGTQNGLNRTNELGESLSEYSGIFAQAGYSAQEYFQLLENGLGGGANNLTEVKDAVNEVATRLADGTIAESIGSYSEETQELFRAWQDGEASQKDVINSIVGDIAGCKGQQDALNMAAAAFGPMAESGNQGFIESLNTIGTSYDTVSGSAQNLYNQTVTPMQEMESNTRELQQALAPLGEILLNLANQIVPPLVAGVQMISGLFSSLPEPVQNFIVILGALITAFTTVAPVIAAVALAVTNLNLPLLAVIGVIAGVAAAIAGIIAVFQNWGTIVEWFQGLWQTMQEVFGIAWNGIVLFFTDTIPQAWQSLVAVFQGIPEWWSGIWQQVSAVFGEIWTSILQNPVLSAITELIINLWNSCVENLSLIWTTIQTVAFTAWELIKNVILGPVLLLCDLVTGNFNKLMEDAGIIWNNIKVAASTIWTSLKTMVSGIVTNLKDTVITTITSLKDLIAGLWETIKLTASELWEGIKQTIVDIVTNIKEQGIETFNNLKEEIGKTVSQIPQVVEEGFQGAIDFITGLPEKAFQWGKDFISGLIDGIKSMIASVGDAVGDVADTISDWLHFSRPEKGPLHYYESWMPDFMEGMAKGISDNMWRVLDRVRTLNEEMADTMQIQGQQGKQPFVVQNYNVFAVDGKPIAEIVNEQLGMAL